MWTGIILKYIMNQAELLNRVRIPGLLAGADILKIHEYQNNELLYAFNINNNETDIGDSILTV